MKEIKTNGITILFAEVPYDANNYIVYMGYLQFRQPNYKTFISEKDLNNPIKTIKHIQKHEKSELYISGTPIKLPIGQYQILGKSTESIHELLGISKESYLSLLEANGIVDRNSASHPSDIDPTNRSHYDKIEQEWQQAQSKVKTYLVLKKL